MDEEKFVSCAFLPSVVVPSPPLPVGSSGCSGRAWGVGAKVPHFTPPRKFRVLEFISVVYNFLRGSGFCFRLEFCGFFFVFFVGMSRMLPREDGKVARIGFEDCGWEISRHAMAGWWLTWSGLQVV